MPPIRVVGIAKSNYVQSVLLALREKGLDHELVPPEDGLDGPLHRRLHPWGKVPVMIEGDFVLYETSAILRYLDTLASDPALMPSEPRAAARAEQWISATNAYLDRHVIRDLAVPAMKARGAGAAYDPAPEILAAIEADLGILEAALAPSPFLLGETPTLPDLLAAPILNYAAQIAWTRPMVEARPNLRRFLDAIHARPAAEGVMRRPW